jgi:hypothetical protein
LSENPEEGQDSQIQEESEIGKYLKISVIDTGVGISKEN